MLVHRAPLRKRCASKGAAPKEEKTAARTTCMELRCLVCEAPVLEPFSPFTLASLSSPLTQKKGLQHHVGPGGESKPNQCVSPLPSVTYWIEPALNHLRKDLICVVHTDERRLIFSWLLSTLTTPVPTRHQVLFLAHKYVPLILGGTEAGCAFTMGSQRTRLFTPQTKAVDELRHHERAEKESPRRGSLTPSLAFAACVPKQL